MSTANVTRFEFEQMQGRLRRMQLVSITCVITVSVLFMTAFNKSDVSIQDEVRTKRLVVVDSGGFGTFSDGRVVLAMDAPKNVGSPMRDRIGMVVGADGSSYIMLIDNQTRGVARMESNKDGQGSFMIVRLFPPWERSVIQSIWGIGL